MVSFTNERRLIFKVIVAGPGGVGKTSLVNRFENGRFIPARMTIGVDFVAKELVVGGRPVTLSIWDFSGEQRFLDLFPDYVRGASGALVCFETSLQRDITSLQLLIPWIEIIREQNGDIPILLVGTKIDCVDEEQLQEIQEIATPILKEFELNGLFFTSSLDGRGVSEVFYKISEFMLEYTKKHENFYQ